MTRSVRRQVVHPEVVRRATVVRIEEGDGGLRRIVLGGPELGEFERDGMRFPPLASVGFDDFVRLFFPTDTGEVVVPVQKDRSVEWPHDPKPVTRNYTVRRHDPRTGELTLDFVTHETGVASTWGRRCRIGDGISLLGPVRSGLVPRGVDRMLLVADETALPAVARLLEELAAPPEAPRGPREPEGDTPGRIDVVLDAPGLRASAGLVVPPGIPVTVHHVDAERGETSESVVRALEWPDGSVHAWVAGESTSLKGIRRYLRAERGLPAECVEVTGYWRRAAVVTRADDPEVPDLAATGVEPFEKLTGLAEIVAPFAIRAANTLRIPHHVAEGAHTLDALAARTGTDPAALARFVRYLVTTDVLAYDGTDGVRLADVGEAVLADDWITQWLDLDGIEARVELSITGLVGALRTGGAARSALTGATLDEDLARQDDLADGHHRHIADEAAFLGSALAAEYPFDGLRRIALSGAGSGVVASALLAGHDDLAVTIVGMPSELERIRRDVDATGSGRVSWRCQDVSTPITDETFDAVVLLETTGRYRDADLAHVLRAAAGCVTPGGALVVVDRTLDPGDDGVPHEDAAELDLLMLCMHGTGLRTEAELAGVARTAGLRVRARRVVGWGITVLDLEPDVTAVTPT